MKQRKENKKIYGKVSDIVVKATPKWLHIHFIYRNINAESNYKY